MSGMAFNTRGDYGSRRRIGTKIVANQVIWRPSWMILAYDRWKSHARGDMRLWS